MKKLYSLLLQLYPARFREEFAAPLERQFADEYRDTEGAGAQAMLWLRTLGDLAVTIPRELLREVNQDLRYAARVYRKRSLATVLALGALALAIGATTGVFSVVNALLIRSLPFRQPEQLVQIQFPPVQPFAGRAPFYAWRDAGAYLTNVAGYVPAQMNLGLQDRSARVSVAEVSANFFALLGSDAAFGRTFAAEEDLAGRDGVAVIAHSLWQQLFGGDPRVLGSTIYLNGAAATVIGVAPVTFDFPNKTAVWTPTIFDQQHLPKTGASFSVTVGRLKPGIGATRASAIFEAEARRLRPESLQQSGALRPRLLSLREQLAGPVRQASFVLLGLVAFVLSIACANVAHLLLSRVADRRRELVIRSAMGASRARLVQQLITESTLLTAAAAVAGLGVAQWVARVAAAAQPAQLNVQEYSVLDWRVVGFAIALAAITGLLFGVLPALLTGRMQPSHDTMRDRRSASSGSGKMRMALLAMQGAFTLVLMVGAFTLGRSFLRLLGTDLGFQTDRMVTLNVSLSGTRWDNGRMREYYRLALDRLRAIPGVESAAAVGYLPLVEAGFMASAFDLDAGHRVSSAPVNMISPDYFRTMRTRVVEGREFNAADVASSEPVAIVNEEFARELGVGPHLTGKRLWSKWPQIRNYTVVGVVQSARTAGPGNLPTAQIFFPAEQFTPGFVTFVAHVHGEVAAYLVVCRDAVQQVDGQVPVYDVKSMDERLSETLARPRFYATAVLFLGSFALLLAVVGIYGVASYSIAQRTHEIGVRIAIGATPGGLRGMLLWQSLLPLGCGVLVGLAGAAALGQYLRHLIAGAESTGPWTCAIAAATLAVTAALAVWSATRRIVKWIPPLPYERSKSNRAEGRTKSRNPLTN